MSEARSATAPLAGHPATKPSGVLSLAPQSVPRPKAQSQRPAPASSDHLGFSSAVTVG